MNATKLVLLLLLAGCGMAKAQSISQEQFNSAVDYVNCKAIQLTQKDVKAFNEKCNCDNHPTYDSIKNAIPAVGAEKTLALSVEIDNIKRAEYSPNMSAAAAVELLSESIFSDNSKFKKIFEFANKPGREAALAQLKAAIKNKVTKMLPAAQAQAAAPDAPVKAPDSPVAAKPITPAVQVADTPADTPKSWFNGFTFGIDIFSILLAVGLVFLIIRLLYGGLRPVHTVSSETKNFVVNYVNEIETGRKQEQSNSNGNGAIKLLKEEIEKLKNELRLVNRKYDDLKNAQVYNPAVTAAVEAAPAAATVITDLKPVEAKPQQEIFFLSTPNADGSFNESSASVTYREGASIYRFTRIDGNKASFQIDEQDASIRLAMQYPDKNIDPVCEATNAFNPRCKRIVTIAPGEAELVGDKWVKTDKAKISYES